MENRDSSEVVPKENKEICDVKETAQNNINIFEKRNLKNNVIQTCVLILGVISASWFGYYQVKINSQLVELNKMSLDLLLFPSLEVTFNESKKEIDIFNKSQYAVEIWGTQVNDSPPRIEKEGRLITPNSYYWLNGKKL